jgi:hypothetical protein
MHIIIAFQEKLKMDEFFESQGSKFTQVDFDLDNPLVFSCNSNAENMDKLASAHGFNFWKQKQLVSKKFIRV